MTTTQPTAGTSVDAVLSGVRGAVETLERVSSTVHVIERSASDFGRSIKASLQQLDQHPEELVQLSLHNTPIAVVMSQARFAEIQALAASMDDMLKDLRRFAMRSLEAEYDSLVGEMATSSAREATDALFAATGDQLRTGFAPGRTERP